MRKMQFIRKTNGIHGNDQIPNFAQLHHAFQTPGKLCLKLEVLASGELLRPLEKEGVFVENQTRFYLDEITLVIGYLHSMGIIYRDLKSEIMLLDIEGHVKLMDFGLFKERVDQEHLAHSFLEPLKTQPPG